LCIHSIFDIRVLNLRSASNKPRASPLRPLPPLAKLLLLQSFIQINKNVIVHFYF
jgi:hypothetical protein